MKKAFYIFIITFVGLSSLTSFTSNFDEVIDTLEEIVDEIDIDYSHLAQTYDDDGVNFKSQRRIIVSENTTHTSFKAYLNNVFISYPCIKTTLKSKPNSTKVILWEHDAISYQHRFQLF